VKLTAREWNSKASLEKTLRHITFSLNLDINLLGLKQTQDSKHLYKCEQDHAKCYVPFYKFQNPLTKLMIFEESSFSPVTILEYKKKYYILNIFPLQPFLISELSTPSIYFEGHTIGHDDIVAIVANKPVSYPFSIAVYSAFSYVKYKHSKSAKSTVIGQYQVNSDHMLHVFMTPSIASSQFTLCLLDQTWNESIPGNIKNTYCNPHITEGKQNFRSNHREASRDVLNQNFCVCDHPDTKRCCLPTKRSFKSLGNIQKKKKIGVSLPF